MGIPELFLCSLAFPLSSTRDIWNGSCNVLLDIFQVDNHSQPQPFLNLMPHSDMQILEKQMHSIQYLIRCHDRSSVPEFWHWSFISPNNPPSCRLPLDLPAPLNLNKRLGLYSPTLGSVTRREKEYLCGQSLSVRNGSANQSQNSTDLEIPTGTPLSGALSLKRRVVSMYSILAKSSQFH